MSWDHTPCFVDSLTYSINEREVYDFAQFPVPSSCVFARSKFSYAFVNKKPVLNGRILLLLSENCRVQLNLLK